MGLNHADGAHGLKAAEVVIAASARYLNPCTTRPRKSRKNWNWRT
jgi:hypothetical protein